jgi:membrane protease YdiL (CAAX protease family)
MPRASSAALFFVLAAIAIVFLQVGHAAFPGELAGAYAGRLACSTVSLLVLIAGSRWLLERDAIDAGRLQVGVGARHGKAFLFGAGIGTAHICLLVAILYLALPFEISAGPLPAEKVALAGVNYFAGNFVEELLFRGYLLVVLARWLGTTRAIWLLALPFGLFHYPGLDPVALAKMILTTGAMHFVYAYLIPATRSLWAAVAAHAIGNTLLHQVFGVGEPALLATHFRQAPPTDIDVPFLVFFGVTGLVAFGLSRWRRTRDGAAEYQLSA